MKSLRRKETQFIHYIHLRKYHSLFCCCDSCLLFTCLFTSESHGGLKLRWLSRSIEVRTGPRPLGPLVSRRMRASPERRLPQGAAASFCWEQCLERDSSVSHQQAVFLEAGEWGPSSWRHGSATLPILELWGLNEIFHGKPPALYLIH